MNKLEALEALEDSAGGLQLPHFKCRIATLTTTLHQLHRYQLTVAKKLLRVNTLMGMPVTAQVLQNYHQFEEWVQQRRTNVHDIFLWQEDAQEINMGDPEESYIQPSLWRIAE